MIAYIGDRPLKTRITKVTYSQEMFRTRYVDNLEKEEVENVWFLLTGMETDSVSLFGDKIKETYLKKIFDTKQPTQELINTDKTKGLILKYYNLELRRKHLLIYLDDTTIYTYQETNDNLFDLIITRIQSNVSITRKSKSERLFVVLLDHITYLYYGALESVTAKVTALDDLIYKKRSAKKTEKLLIDSHLLKKKINEMLNDLDKFQEVLTKFITSDESQFFSEASINCLNNIIDNCNKISDKLQNNKNNLDSLIQLYLSFNSNDMNEIMKFLTVISAFFLPLSFITAWYGMNFTLPEVHWEYGYQYITCVAIAIVLILYIYFKRKEWL